MAVSSRARWGFGIAAAACIETMLGHELLGGSKGLIRRHRVDPPADVVWLRHSSWHLGSTALVAIAVTIVLVVRSLNQLMTAGCRAATNAGFAMLGISLALFGDVTPRSTPAPQKHKGRAAPDAHK